MNESCMKEPATPELFSREQHEFVLRRMRKVLVNENEAALNVVFVIGQPGVGKTVLAKELSFRLQRSLYVDLSKDSLPTELLPSQIIFIDEPQSNGQISSVIEWLGSDAFDNNRSNGNVAAIFIQDPWVLKDVITQGVDEDNFICIESYENKVFGLVLGSPKRRVVDMTELKRAKSSNYENWISFKSAGYMPLHKDIQSKVVFLQEKVGQLEIKEKILNDLLESIAVYQGNYPAWKCLQEFRDLTNSFDKPPSNPCHFEAIDDYLTRLVGAISSSIESLCRNKNGFKNETALSIQALCYENSDHRKTLWNDPITLGEEHKNEITRKIEEQRK
ncbi:AAA family ATPase [Thiomicrorhabdus indica]|uniref:AAA family ATPase n=1 Tax=Thiomicrorhabdus indica TaxID=2267253 RepID=UPI00102D68B0|nr:AAA family ATPase [Thiomicrorhabdus indica]